MFFLKAKLMVTAKNINYLKTSQISDFVKHYLGIKNRNFRILKDYYTPVENLINSMTRQPFVRGRILYYSFQSLFQALDSQNMFRVYEVITRNEKEG